MRSGERSISPSGALGPVRHEQSSGDAYDDRERDRECIECSHDCSVNECWNACFGREAPRDVAFDSLKSRGVFTGAPALPEMFDTPVLWSKRIWLFAGNGRGSTITLRPVVGTAMNQSKPGQNVRATLQIRPMDKTKFAWVVTLLDGSGNALRTEYSMERFESQDRARIVGERAMLDLLAASYVDAPEHLVGRSQRKR